jgi:stage V sporulation protein B
MGNKRSGKTDSFIMQAGILAAAGIIVRIIGILYRSPLAAVIGDEGNGYYGYAYNIYTNILLVSSYSIPSAISKVMASKLAYRQYRNAQRMFRCALVYVIVIGGAASLFAYFAAPVLVVGNAVGVLRIFAPTIFLSGLLGVLRGYFQAHKSMVQTSVSQILEQILNATVSIGAAYLFVRSAGVKAAAAGLGSTQTATSKAIAGACGSALGTGCGVVIALLFMLWIYMINRPCIRRQLQHDRTEETDSDRQIYRDIFFIVTPFILSTFIYNCSTAVNQTVYTNIMLGVKKVRQEDAATLYGIFSGKAIVLRNIPVALASAMSAAIIPNIASAWAVRDKKDACGKVTKAIKATMIVAIPCMTGLTVLARPVVMLLFPQKASVTMASELLMALAPTVIFYCVSTITNGVLQSIGHVNKPVIHAAVALAVQFAVLELLLRLTELNLFALVAADIVYSLLMCIMNGLAVRKYMGYRQEFMNTYIKPLLCSLVMGGAAYVVYTNLYRIIHSNAAALLAAIAAAVVVYFYVVLVTGVLTEDEMRGLPKGTSLIRIARKMKLFH